MSKPIGVHLVGSLPFGSTNEALTKTSYALAEHISTIPDGEVGDRWLFTMWQTFAFPPEIHGPMDRNFKPLNNYDFECKYEHIQPTKYDEMAISSYKTFCKLRDEGVIPKGVRFQVSLPTVMNSVWVHADFRYREHVTPLYERRLLEDIRRLQDAIPAHDLAIQFTRRLSLPIWNTSVVPCPTTFSNLTLSRQRWRLLWMG